jgi:hypothetical protein
MEIICLLPQLRSFDSLLHHRQAIAISKLAIHSTMADDQETISEYVRKMIGYCEKVSTMIVIRKFVDDSMEVLLTTTQRRN